VFSGDPDPWVLILTGAGTMADGISKGGEEIIRLLEKSKLLPVEIKVRSQSIMTILEPIARAPGIRLRG